MFLKKIGEKVTDVTKMGRKQDWKRTSYADEKCCLQSPILLTILFDLCKCRFCALRKQWHLWHGKFWLIADRFPLLHTHSQLSPKLRRLKKKKNSRHAWNPRRKCDIIDFLHVTTWREMRDGGLRSTLGQDNSTISRKFKSSDFYYFGDFCQKLVNMVKNSINLISGKLHNSVAPVCWGEGNSS